MFRRLSWRAARTVRSRAQRRRLALEPLEDRRVLAVMTVTSLADGTLGELEGDGLLSLREAIHAINTGAPVDGIAPTSGEFGVDDEIVFDPDLFTGGPEIITLVAGELSLTRSLTITGPGATLLTIDASGNDSTPGVADGMGSRIFLIDDGNFGADSPVAISGLTLTGGDANSGGGAIRSLESLTLVDSVVTGNAAIGPGLDGGGIFASTQSGTVNITRTAISNNTAMDVGGGIYAYTNTGSVSISASTIAGNSGSYGGGIFARNVAGTLTITDSTISDNEVGNQGAGVWALTGSGMSEIVNSTISGNMAGDHGGGVWAYTDTGTTTVAHSTITDNTANADLGESGSGGGLYGSGGGTLTIQHSIIAANHDTTDTAPDLDLLTDVPGAANLRFNLIGDNRGSGLTEAPIGAPDSDGNLIGDPAGAGAIDPLLGALADNGGATLTHALLDGSPAIDAGDPTAVAGVDDVPQFDQRGDTFARVLDGDGDTIARIDIGAFEAPEVIVIPARVTLNVGMELVIEDTAPGGVDEDIALSVDGDFLVVEDPDQPLSSDIAGAEGDGTNTLRIPLAAIAGNRVIVNTNAGNDTLAVHASVTAAGLEVDFDGGSGDNALALIGTGVETATYTPSATTTGDGVVEIDGVNVTFVNLSPVDITGMGGAFVLTAGAADVLTVEEGVDFASGGTNQALRVSGTSGGVPIEAVALWNNLAVTINTTLVDGNDTITITSASNAHENDTLAIVTGAGVDFVNVDGDATFTGDVVIRSQNVMLTGTITAGGRVTLEAIAGAIVDAAANDVTKIAAAEALLLAATGIGHADAIETSVGQLDVTNSAANNIQIANSGPLQLVDLNSDTFAVDAVAGVSIVAASPLTISSDVTVGAASTFTAADSPNPGDDLTIADGVTITGNANLLTFNAGDDFLLAATATIDNAGSVVFVNGDAGDADPGVGSSIMFLGTVMANGVSLSGGPDNDTFVVAPSTTTPIAVLGGPPVFGDPGVPPGDRLIVPLGGIFDAVVPNVPPANGMVTFAAASHQTIQFTSIESLLAIGPDQFEPNDSIATAVILGSPTDVILRDLTIDHPADVDYFRIAAHHTGKLIARIYFEHLVGDLNLEIVDRFGNVLAEAVSTTDDEELVIPVVSQQPYFVRVYGEAGAINDYTLEIENFAAPVPTAVLLDPVSDNGRLNNDNITSQTLPTFFIHVDVLNFIDPDGDGVFHFPALDATQAAAGETGIAVELRLVNSTDPLQPPIIVFADPLSPDFPTLYTVTLTEELPEGVYVASAATRFFDGQGDELGDPAPASGRSNLSVPLWLTIDTTPPEVFWGDAAVPDDGLDPASDTGVPGQPATIVDRITSDTTPTLWGTSEAGATIRVYVLDAAGVRMLIGETVATPFTGNNPLVTGRWSLTSQIDMNDPLLGFLDIDGLRQFEVEAEDIAGNVSEPVEFEIFIDTQGPFVDDILAFTDGVINTEFDLTGTKGAAAQPTPRVDGITLLFSDFPLRTDDFLYPAVNLTQAITAGNFRLVGDRVGLVTIVDVIFTDNTLSGGPGLTDVTLVFARPLADDRYTLTVLDNLRDDAGNRLDGELPGFGGTPFPSGDLVPGGDFVIQFTVDAAPEIGVWAAGTVLIDINGNSLFDPSGGGTGDLAFLIGRPSDYIFAGNFVAAGGVADGFDKLAAYGRVGTQFRWLIDVDNDGVPDLNIAAPEGVNGIPVAGNFDGNPDTGDFVGLFTGTDWHIDTTGDFLLDTTVAATGYGGFPIVGDFNGDGFVDLGAYRASHGNNNFSIVLASAHGVWPTTASTTFRVGTADGFSGFPGVRERPFAADFNGDGITDIGLWVPDGTALEPGDRGEWFAFLSDPATGTTLLDRAAAGGGFIPFTPAPFGNDLYAQFGNSYALPLVGNFDPPPPAAVAAPSAAAPVAAAPTTVSQPATNATSSAPQSTTARNTTAAVTSTSTTVTASSVQRRPATSSTASASSTATTASHELSVESQSPDIGATSSVAPPAQVTEPTSAPATGSSTVATAAVSPTSSAARRAVSGTTATSNGTPVIVTASQVAGARSSASSAPPAATSTLAPIDPPATERVELVTVVTLSAADDAPTADATPLTEPNLDRPIVDDMSPAPVERLEVNDDMPIVVEAVEVVLDEPVESVTIEALPAVVEVVAPIEVPVAIDSGVESAVSQEVPTTPLAVVAPAAAQAIVTVSAPMVAKPETHTAPASSYSKPAKTATPIETKVAVPRTATTVAEERTVNFENRASERTVDRATAAGDVNMSFSFETESAASALQRPSRSWLPAIAPTAVDQALADLRLSLVTPKVDVAAAATARWSARGGDSSHAASASLSLDLAWDAYAGSDRSSLIAP